MVMLIELTERRCFFRQFLQVLKTHPGKLSAELANGRLAMTLDALVARGHVMIGRRKEAVDGQHM